LSSPAAAGSPNGIFNFPTLGFSLGTSLGSSWSNPPHFSFPGFSAAFAAAAACSSFVPLHLSFPTSLRLGPTSLGPNSGIFNFPTSLNFFSSFGSSHFTLPQLHGFLSPSGGPDPFFPFSSAFFCASRAFLTCSSSSLSSLLLSSVLLVLF